MIKDAMQICRRRPWWFVMLLLALEAGALGLVGFLRIRYRIADLDAWQLADHAIGVVLARTHVASDFL